jgi:4-oxalocrotonate tautomerase
MPLAMISTLQGVSQDQKRAVIASVTNALAESLSVPPASVRVLVTEVDADAWGVGGVPLSER